VSTITFRLAALGDTDTVLRILNEAAEWLDGVLADVGTNGGAKKSRTKAATATA